MIAMNTDPYPWPWDEATRPLTGDSLAVVVCGWQPHWVPMLDWPSDPSTEIHRIARLVDTLRSLGATVLWLRHGAPTATNGRPSALPAVESNGWGLLPGPLDHDVVIDVPGFDAFLVEWTDLELRGRGLTRLVMCGLGTESTVSSTTRSANDRGHECLTATDATVHHAAVTGAAQLSSITMSGGIFGAIGTAAELIAILQSAPTTATRKEQP